MSSHPAIKDLFGIRIDKFLSSLSDEAKRKMWPIVNALRLELELSGSTTFPVPVDKLRRNRCSDEDTKAVLANLHRQGILSVSVRYKIKYRPDEFSVQTIEEHPEIYDYPQATISLKKEQLAYLYTKLELFVHPEKLAAAKNAIKILLTKSKTGQYSEIDNIVKRVEQECLAIEDGASHRSLRDFWLNTKRVLDIICSKLYSGLDGQPKQEIPISLDEFYTRVSRRQERAIHETLENLIKKGVVSAKRPTLDDESIYLHKDRIFYNGHATLVIKNADYLKNLRHKLSILAEFVEKDGKNRFPLHYPPQPEKLQQQLKAIKIYSEKSDQEERIANKVAEKLQGAKASQIHKLQENKEHLGFYPETGDITLRGKQGDVTPGGKGFALLSVLSAMKNTPFSLQEIIDGCNPKVNKPAHYFKKEKDIDDTIRHLKSKLNVSNKAFFPIEKRGAKGKKKWRWIEK